MERRGLPRLAIKNATVRFKRSGFSTFLGKFSPQCPLQNLSKSGLSFYTRQSIDPGERIFLKVFFPDGFCIPLKGIVKWRQENPNDNGISVGVHFLPFGTHKEYNDLKSLEYLRKLLPNDSPFHQDHLESQNFN